MRVEDLLELLATRRSVRRFTDAPVSDEEIRMLLRAASSAPSNSNRQGWKFLVVKSDSLKGRLAVAVEKQVAAIRASLKDPDLIAAFDAYAAYLTFFQNAPVVIVALTKQTPSFLERVSRELGLDAAIGKTNPEIMSTSMAIQNMQLAAHALGLGSCCMTGPSLAAAEIESILDVRPPFHLTALVPVGHYETWPPATPRKDLALISEVIE